MWATVPINSEEAPCFVLLLSAHDSFSCLRVAGNQSGAAGARSAKCTLSVRDRGTNTGKLYEHARKNVQELTELSVVFVRVINKRSQREGKG